MKKRLLRYSVSPAAWRHVNLIGKFEFTAEAPQVDIDALAARHAESLVEGHDKRASAVIVRQDPKHTGFGTDSIGAQRQFPVALADEKSAAGPGNPDLSLVLDFHEYCAGHAKFADQMKMPVQQPITVALPNNQNVRTHYFSSLAHHVVIFSG